MAGPNDIDGQGQSHSEYTKAYVDILEVYKDQIKSSIAKKNALKDEFFKVIKSIMLLLTWMSAIVLVLSIILFGVMAFSGSTSITVLAGAVVSVVSSLVTIVLAIFKLPDIVATYLFNKDEDNQMVNIIKNIQDYETKYVEQEIERLKLEQSVALNDSPEDSAIDPDGTDKLGLSSHASNGSEPVSIDDVGGLGSDSDTVSSDTGNNESGDLPPKPGSGSGSDDSGTSDGSGTSGDSGASA